MNIRKQPYHLLLPAVIIISLMAWFWTIDPSSTLDIHIHDTYFILPDYRYAMLAVSVFVLFFWLFYLAVNKLLYSRALTWVHVIITALSALLLAMGMIFSTAPSSMQFKYYDQTNGHSILVFARIMEISFSLLFLIQILLVINFIAGLIKLVTRRL